MATFADREPGNLQPVCQNCTTSTTPLWRRDEVGSVLCNACGLFLKLHGTPRPISLKTDVIKSRNREKTAGQGQKRKVRQISNYADPLLNRSSHYSTVTDYPHLNLRAPLLLFRVTPTLSDFLTILGLIARIRRPPTPNYPVLLLTLLPHIFSTVFRLRSIHSNLPQSLRSSCVNPRQAPRHRSMIVT